MDELERAKYYLMLKYMSQYSIKQPKAIGDLCTNLYVSSAYVPAIDMMVEAFLTVHSFALLMSEGLLSNAFAILRILIEQVATISVICSNSKAMYEFLKFQSWKKKYYGSTGKEHDEIRKVIIEACGYKKESSIKDYLDYGWIRVLNDDKSERGDRLIIKEAHLEEMIFDINEHLNAYAHGQKSMFLYIKDKKLADAHISRLIMISGKLFLFLCYSKHELLENYDVSEDKCFSSYINAKILFLDLNAKATNERIIDYIQSSNNVNKDIVLTKGTIDHIRGLMYRSELNVEQVNSLAKTYAVDVVNILFMLINKLYSTTKDNLFEGVSSLRDLLNKISIQKIDNLYCGVPHEISIRDLFDMMQKVDDKWGPMKQNGQFETLDETFITDCSSLVHCLYEHAFPNNDNEDSLDLFVSKY